MICAPGEVKELTNFNAAVREDNRIGTTDGIKTREQHNEGYVKEEVKELTNFYAAVREDKRIGTTDDIKTREQHNGGYVKEEIKSLPIFMLLLRMITDKAGGLHKNS